MSWWLPMWLAHDSTESVLIIPPLPRATDSIFSKTKTGTLHSICVLERRVVGDLCVDPSHNKTSRVAYQYYGSEVTQITLFPPTMVKSISSFALLQTSYFMIRNNAVRLTSTYEFCETLGQSYLKAHATVTNDILSPLPPSPSKKRLNVGIWSRDPWYFLFEASYAVST